MEKIIKEEGFQSTSVGGVILFFDGKQKELIRIKIKMGQQCSISNIDDSGTTFRYKLIGKYTYDTRDAMANKGEYNVNV